jgi:hypothetical protein
MRRGKTMIEKIVSHTLLSSPLLHIQSSDPGQDGRRMTLTPLRDRGQSIGMCTNPNWSQKEWLQGGIDCKAVMVAKARNAPNLLVIIFSLSLAA